MTEYITLALAGIAAVLSLVCVLIRPKQGATLRDLQNLSQELQEEMRALRTEVGGTIHGTLQSTAELQANAQRQVAEAQNTRLRELSEQLAVRQTALQARPRPWREIHSPARGKVPKADGGVPKARKRTLIHPFGPPSPVKRGRESRKLSIPPGS